MGGVGAAVWSQGQAEWGAWVVLTGRCGYLHWVELRGAGLSCGGCLRGGVDLEIGSG